MQRHADALGAEVRGHSDLTLGDLKFSGNAQRRKRRYLLFHGSFLLNLDIEHIERLLPMPSREPDYRHHRAHREFLMNVSLAGRNIQDALRQTWNAPEMLRDVPVERITALATTASTLPLTGRSSSDCRLLRQTGQCRADLSGVRGGVHLGFT